MSTLKKIIKIPLVLIENILFLIFPKLRIIIEKYVFNPYQFNEKHLTYSQKQFNAFLEKIGGKNSIKNKTILELGPGGSIGFGLLALKNGASNYLAIDDGIHAFITKKQMDWYRKLSNYDDKFIKEIFKNKNGKYYYNESKIKFITINQNSKYSLPDKSVDFIYSCAVLEHVHNLDLCFSEMSRVLKSKGIMNHQVDLRDHIFSQDSLWFLTINDFWFTLLFKNTGEYVNRKRISYYHNLIKKYSLHIIKLKKDKIVYDKKIPKKLTKTYSDNDLRTFSINILLKKCK
jgi:SAM-dependent methyltransferase